MRKRHVEPLNGKILPKPQRKLFVEMSYQYKNSLLCSIKLLTQPYQEMFARKLKIVFLLVR